MGLSFILDATNDSYGLCANSTLVARAFLVKYFCKEGYTPLSSCEELQKSWQSSRQAAASATADGNGSVKEQYPYSLEEIEIKPKKTQKIHSWFW